ncbi:hypothetical protein Pla108_09030 [Botrimarina colliarenosi]|uniref:Uncharacterized protein n=1 Tax=Botrimarina colliarenosi TaxID=2528001 RepID=A0A5C6AJY8_9BACT|nr:hypothetical protein [Botrimarina colliarenosi]TWT99959.1 hypothetical protein Pla108_09030 [Botrimarina colliarenosi]
MQRVLTMLVVLTTGVPAFSDPPPERMVQEITDLREQVGTPLSTNPNEFAEALRSVDGQQQRQQKLANDYWSAPPSQNQYQTPQPQAWANDQPYEPSNRANSPTSWPTAPSANPWSLSPGHQRFVQPAGGSGWSGSTTPTYGRPQPNRPPQVMLRESAFQLDQMAHELEMSERYDEADALRQAAGKLRDSARKVAETKEKEPAQAEKSRPESADGAKDDRTQTAERAHMVERVRRAIGEANERAERLQKELGEAQQRIRRQERELQERRRSTGEQRNRVPQEAEREGDRRRRRPDRGGDQPEIEPGMPQPNYDLIAPPEAPGAPLPPQGVHGGPTEPPATPDLSTASPADPH